MMSSCSASWMCRPTWRELAVVRVPRQVTGWLWSQLSSSLARSLTPSVPDLFVSQTTPSTVSASSIWNLQLFRQDPIFFRRKKLHSARKTPNWFFVLFLQLLYNFDDVRTGRLHNYVMITRIDLVILERFNSMLNLITCGSFNEGSDRIRIGPVSQSNKTFEWGTTDSKYSHNRHLLNDSG